MYIYNSLACCRSDDGAGTRQLTSVDV